MLWDICLNACDIIFLSLRQVSNMCHHKPDLLLFRSIAGTGDLLSKHALGIL